MIPVTAGVPLGAPAVTPVAMLPRAEGRVLPAGESWPADTALLLLPYEKNERYVAPALENLALFWPNHPNAFKAPTPDLEVSHDMVEDGWPSFRSGFLKLGRFSRHLARPHDFSPSPLLAMVQQEYRSAGSLPERFRRTLTRWERHARHKLDGLRGTA